MAVSLQDLLVAMILMLFNCRRKISLKRFGVISTSPIEIESRLSYNGGNFILKFFPERLNLDWIVLQHCMHHNVSIIIILIC